MIILFIKKVDICNIARIFKYFREICGLNAMNKESNLIRVGQESEGDNRCKF